MSKPEVVVVAGGRWQIPLIQFLKQKGYSVSVVDPFATSPGVSIADHWYQADVRDYQLVYQLLKEKNVRFITTDQSDISVYTVAYVSEKLGLPGNSPDVVLRFSNKFVSREFAAEVGVRIPKFFKIRNLSDFKSAVSESDLPFIIKPVDSQSSRGIHKIDSYDLVEIESAICEALSHTQTDYVLAEQFITGRELTVEGVANQGQHTTIAISLKKHFRTGIASELLYPAPVPEKVRRKIIDNNDLYVNESGLKFGITHAEYIWDEGTNEVYLVEIACRGGGSLIGSDIGKWVSGVDTYELLVDNLEDRTHNFDPTNLDNRSAILYFFEFPSGKIKSISGLESAKALPGVFELDLEFKPGDTIKNAADDRSRQGFVIIFERSPEALQQTLSQVKNSITVEYE